MTTTAYGIVHGAQSAAFWLEQPLPGTVVVAPGSLGGATFRLAPYATGSSILLLDPPIFTSAITPSLQVVAGAGAIVQLFLVQDWTLPQFSVTKRPSDMVPVSKLLDTLVAAVPTTHTFSTAIAFDDIWLPTRSRWAGAVNLFLVVTGGPGSATFDASTWTLSYESIPFITGRSGNWDAMSRVDRCPRCGRVSLRETWVEDGYSRGLLVCPECWDPEDTPPRKPRPEMPGVNE